MASQKEVSSFSLKKDGRVNGLSPYRKQGMLVIGKVMLCCMPLHCLLLFWSDMVFCSYQTAAFASTSPEKTTKKEQEKVVVLDRGVLL